ncbi:hypothetical protein AMTR_s00068p00204840 [Amborella trichopoda]|uniref:Uncharacterized protein n=1 Tax=Amborella trichopoda TaxID=13333 RepID=U5DGF9_AMBTC|nr:hypothetical protein AMTR_s00068p00204840 [Amborella trichopoda]
MQEGLGGDLVRVGKRESTRKERSDAGVLGGISSADWGVGFERGGGGREMQEWRAAESWKERKRENFSS